MRETRISSQKGINDVTGVKELYLGESKKNYKKNAVFLRLKMAESWRLEAIMVRIINF